MPSTSLSDPRQHPLLFKGYKECLSGVFNLVLWCTYLFHLVLGDTLDRGMHPPRIPVLYKFTLRPIWHPCKQDRPLLFCSVFALPFLVARRVIDGLVYWHPYRAHVPGIVGFTRAGLHSFLIALGTNALFHCVWFMDQVSAVNGSVGTLLYKSSLFISINCLMLPRSVLPS